MVQASLTMACYPGSKIATENVDVFANAWSVQINDLSVLVKDVNDSCHGRSDKQVYLSLPRPGVSVACCCYILPFNSLILLGLIFKINVNQSITQLKHIVTMQTRKALLMQRGTWNSGACLNFESPVKQNQSPAGARRPAANYLLCFTCTHQSAPPVSLSQCHMGWKSLILITPCHLVPLFRVTTFEFMEKLYSFWN